MFKEGHGRGGGSSYVLLLNMHIEMLLSSIALFRPIAVFCGIDNIL